MATIKKACKGALYPKSSSVSKRLGSPSKAKNGKSFPDLNKDGKVTRKDVLIGRGVLPKTAKKGMKIKKAQDGKKMSYAEKEADAKKRYESGTTPKLEGFNPLAQRYQSIDTSGYAGGKRTFPAKTVSNSDKKNPERTAKYSDVNRDQVKSTIARNSYTRKKLMKKEGNTDKYDSYLEKSRAIQRKGGVTKKSSSSSSKMKMMKMGGKMTKKCKYGCK
jgi:hypothetical protein